MTAVAVAPDGSWLASGGGDGTVRIWDAATGQERATLHRSHRRVSGGGGGAGWQLAGLRRQGRDGADLGCGDRAGAGHLKATRRGGGGGGGAGRQLAGLRRRDGTVRIWDAATGRERAILTGHTGEWGGGGGAGRQLAGLRRLGRDGADLGCGQLAISSA